MRTSHLVRSALSCAAIGLVLSGCDADFTPEPTQPAPPVSLELFSQPEVSFDPDQGTTTLIVQFVARDGQRIPLDAEELDITMSVDQRPIDVEGILQQDSEALTANVHLTLVLDASYSMLQHSPPAFGPMLAAARRTINAGRTLYLDRPGNFEWDLYWFNDVIYTPLESGADFEWHESDIERIASPNAGTFTKLFAATKTAVDGAILHAEAFGSGPRDQHIVVAFSDGADNYSWFGNADRAGQGSVGTNRQYRWFGAPAMGRAELETVLDEHPEIQVHVMGLGSDVNDTELSSIARAGSGQYFKNGSSTEVDALFNQVISELTSIQTQGVTIPIQPGDYTFRITARDTRGSSRGSLQFRFRGGDETARVLD